MPYKNLYMEILGLLDLRSLPLEKPFVPAVFSIPPLKAYMKRWCIRSKFAGKSTSLMISSPYDSPILMVDLTTSPGMHTSSGRWSFIDLTGTVSNMLRTTPVFHLLLVCPSHISFVSQHIAPHNPKSSTHLTLHIANLPFKLSIPGIRFYLHFLV